ncbi:MAG: helix-turn-helix domain-containing protein [Candidatus Omnitrophica bacterium]|nr:helix-turn-helix domain-containing protein [Candidatus Omnitrophota bacterium]
MKSKDFQELLKSIDQARAIHRGKRKPSRVFHFEPVKVKEIRTRLGLSQSKFAQMLCVSLATLRNWEQGRTYPEGAAIALLRVAESKPEAVLEALHAA